MRCYCVLLISLILTLFVSCSTQKQTAKTTAKNSDNSKVILPSQTIETPTDVNFVYDYENIYTPQEEKKLDTLLRNFEKSNLISIRLTTPTDSVISDTGIDENNIAILHEWEGTHGDSKNCVSILISKKSRRMRIDFGPFVAHRLSSTETQSIIENQFAPYFKEGKYFDGTINGLNAIMDTIRKNIKF